MKQLDYLFAQMASLAKWTVTPQERQKVREDSPIGYIPGLFEKYVAVYKLMESKDYDIAQAILSDIEQNGLVQILLANVQFLQGNVDQSINSLEKLNKVTPNDALLLSTLSYIKGETGNLEEAIEMGETIIEGTTDDDLCSKEYLFNTHYNMACWKYKQQVQKEKPDFSGVYEHLEASQALEQELIDSPFRSTLKDMISSDMKRGYFTEIKNKSEFMVFFMPKV